MLGMDNGPLLDHLHSSPNEWETWDAATLTVGTQTLSARALERAGARAVLSLDLPGLGLIVHSRGLGDSDLSLSEVSDYRGYHFDPAVPLAYPAVLTRSIEAALGTAPD
ncbi:hypothetical protein [Nocardioides sp. zg-1230]|uniref:hypothetical protein n=1 Tax=Nocardioides sp. zg-1230 TaxID=2736601 RepID=UPI001554FA94|nr:hypothetical protein [Nocardioides sp. zg-1230]NPC41676.1 hypothetical protein [Nocardioides sp. zg-1230]